MGQTETTKFELDLYQALTEQFGDSITGQSLSCGQSSISVKSEAIFDLAQFLSENDKFGFELLSDICGVDWIDCPEKRFELIYNFFSIAHNCRLLIRTTLADRGDDLNPTIRSIQPIYSGADWLEREVYDMLGIEFEGHPDLRRIITPDGLEGWPHRKDFPLHYEEPQFSHNKDNPPEITK